MKRWIHDIRTTARGNCTQKAQDRNIWRPISSSEKITVYEEEETKIKIFGSISGINFMSHLSLNQLTEK